MQALGIVDLADEAADVGFGLRERPVLLQVHLLALQRLEEALGPGILCAGRGTFPEDSAS